MHNGAPQPRGSAKIAPTHITEPTDVDEAQLSNRLVLQPWHIRFWDQSTALIYKQLLVYGRNTRATILRLLAPLFFMLLLWLLNIAIRSDNQAISAFEDNPNPKTDVVGPIPTCDDDSFIIQPCWDFVYSPNTSDIANSIAANMRAYNPGRPISEGSVLGFASIADTNAWMLENPEKTLGAVHFLLDANAPTAVPTPGIDFVLQVNSTPKFFKGNFQDPTFFANVPLQVSAEREISRYQWQIAGRDPSALNWDVSTSQFAHPLVGSVDIIGSAMGPFVFAANMFNFVLLLSSIVAERERGLRQALTTAGMMDSAFWGSWLAVEMVISVLFTLLLIGFGAMFSFDFFLRNSFGLVFLLFLTFQWAMTGMAFILSAFISKTATAINLGFIIFIVGWIVQSVIIFGFPYTPDYISSVIPLTVIFTLLPFGPLAKGALDLGAAAEKSPDAVSWSRRWDYCQDIEDNQAQVDALTASDPQAYWDFDCVFPVGNILIILTIEFFVYILLAIYFDNVFANENGVRKKPWYFLSPGYWGWRKRTASSSSSSHAATAAATSLQPPVPCPQKLTQKDPDVVAEEDAMKELLLHRSGAAGSLASQDHEPQRRASSLDTSSFRTSALSALEEAAAAAAGASGGGVSVYSNAAVEVFGLQKAFNRRRRWFSRLPSLTWLRFWKKKNKQPTTTAPITSKQAASAEFWAIKESWFSIERGKLFCLLGPNGAGKTTTINCLTGVLPPTGGDALVFGESITAAGGLDRIRSVMGVCPQFDVLWGELTGIEHLWVYGRVKGLSRVETTSQADHLLESVKLTAAAKQQTMAYSGGMRRRLSVAVALLGDPLIVYLDEPTTGMDPISRRHVWDAIEAAKPGRAIVLTTHSMEEADILGDEVAIMARGWLRAFGTPLRLKQRFGSGYRLSVAVNGVGGSANGSGKNALAFRAQRSASAKSLTAEGVSSDGVSREEEEEESGASQHTRRIDAVSKLFERAVGVGSPTDAGSGGPYLVYAIPKDQEGNLPELLRTLESRRAELGITDVQISLTTLEEVFLSIARRAEIEAAEAEGRNTQSVTLEDGSTLEVAIGEEHATQESTGRRYRIRWAQDESGSLQVLSWTLVDGDGNGDASEAAAASG